MAVTADPRLLEEIASFDTPSVFNCLRTLLGGGPEGEGLEHRGGVPLNYTDQSIRSMLPQLGMAVGYATTCEVTTNTRDFPDLSWESYYDYIEASVSPSIAVFKDVGTKPGRGASLGDVMSTQHKMLGARGIVVDGTIRDLIGLEAAGLPVWATGRVAGHGLFYAVRFDSPVIVGDLAIAPGDLLAADLDGVVSIPAEIDPADLLHELKQIRAREIALNAEYARPDASLASIREYFATKFWSVGKNETKEAQQ
jgi:regulator of RNase E activity RraA